MRVVLIAIILVVITCSLVFADNSKRIEELRAEQTALQGKYTQYQQAMKDLEVRFIQITAIIGELVMQDAVKDTDEKEKE